jgi:DNA-binding PadR family transcriptional regulator
LSTGNFYRELQRLTCEGFVQTTENPQGTDTRRAPYQITQEGVAAFDAWLCKISVRVGEPHEDDLSVRALFFAYAPQERVIEALDNWHAAVWLEIKALERAQRIALSDNASTAHNFGALPYLLSRRQRYLTADLEFLAELRRGYMEWGASRSRSPETSQALANKSPKKRRALVGNGRSAVR